MKRSTLLAVSALATAVLSVTLAVPANATPTNPGLVYSIDARINRSLHPNNPTHWRDISGYGQDAVAAPGEVVYSESRETIKFLGNEYDMGYSLEFKRHSFEHGITVEARVNLGEVDAWERIFDFGNGENADNIMLTRYQDSDNLELEVYDGVNFVGSFMTVGDELRKLKGLHTYTFSADAESLDLFVDGKAVDLYPTADWEFFYHEPRTVERTSSFIGHSNWAVWGDAPLEGTIQYLRIYNLSLDNETIRAHAKSNSRHDSVG